MPLEPEKPQIPEDMEMCADDSYKAAIPEKVEGDPYAAQSLDYFFYAV